MEDRIKHAIQMKLLSRGINATSIDDIDLDQWSSSDESRYIKIIIKREKFQHSKIIFVF